MATWYLCEREDGRTMLSTSDEGEILQTIEANTFAEARRRVDCSEIAFVPGHGWFTKAAAANFSAGFLAARPLELP